MVKISGSIKALDPTRPHEAACYTIFRFLKSVLELSEFISEVNLEITKSIEPISNTYYKGGPLTLVMAGNETHKMSRGENLGKKHSVINESESSQSSR